MNGLILPLAEECRCLDIKVKKYYLFCKDPFRTGQGMWELMWDYGILNNFRPTGILLD
jgi:hypothetical protein